MPRATSLNVTEEVAAQIAELQARTHLSKTAILEAAITAYHATVMAEPTLIIGYASLDRPGDVEPHEQTCIACGETCTSGAWLRVGKTVNVITFDGPLCSNCADSE